MGDTDGTHRGHAWDAWGTHGTHMRRGDARRTHGGCGGTQRTFMGYAGDMCGMLGTDAGDTQDMSQVHVGGLMGTHTMQGHTGDKQGTCWDHMRGLAWDTEGTCGRRRTRTGHTRDTGTRGALVGERAQQACETQDCTGAQGTRESRETRRRHSGDGTRHTQGTNRGHSWDTKDPGREKGRSAEAGAEVPPPRGQRCEES